MYLCTCVGECLLLGILIIVLYACKIGAKSFCMILRYLCLSARAMGECRSWAGGKSDCKVSVSHIPSHKRRVRVDGWAQQAYTSCSIKYWVKGVLYFCRRFRATVVWAVVERVITFQHYMALDVLLSVVGAQYWWWSIR